MVAHIEGAIQVFEPFYYPGYNDSQLANVTQNSLGGFSIIWTQEVYDDPYGDEFDLYVYNYDQDFRLVSSTKVDKINHEIGVNVVFAFETLDDGQLFVGWREWTVEGFNRGFAPIEIQILDPESGDFSSAIDITTSWQNFHFSYDLKTANEEDYFTISYLDFYSLERAYELWHFSADGTATSWYQRDVLDIDWDIYEIETLPIENGGVAVTELLHNDGYDETNETIRLTIFDAGGNIALERDFHSVTTLYENGSSGTWIIEDYAMTQLSDGNILVLWNEKDLVLNAVGNGTIKTSDLKASIFDPSGQIIVENVTIDNDADFTDLQVVPLNEGGFVVVWLEELYIEGNIDAGENPEIKFALMARSFNNDGTPKGDAITVTNLDWQNSISFDVSQLEGDGFAVTWD